MPPSSTSVTTRSHAVPGASSAASSPEVARRTSPREASMRDTSVAMIGSSSTRRIRALALKRSGLTSRIVSRPGASSQRRVAIVAVGIRDPESDERPLPSTPSVHWRLHRSGNCATRADTRGVQRRAAIFILSLAMLLCAAPAAGARPAPVLDLVPSYLPPAGDPAGARVAGRGWTYDSAIVATGLAATGRTDRAARIVGQLAALQRPDGA